MQPYDLERFAVYLDCHMSFRPADAVAVRAFTTEALFIAARQPG
jgi:hypothetical protein